jgi:hypothetical protein
VDQENLETTKQIRELSERIEGPTIEMHQVLTKKDSSTGAS